MTSEDQEFMVACLEMFIDQIVAFPTLEKPECKMAHSLAILEWGITYAFRISKATKESKIEIAEKLHKSRIEYIEQGKC